ncbi:MAG: BA14K family protein [Methylorubrum populi]
MKRIFMASAVLAGALAYLPVTADARPGGGARGAGGFGRGGLVSGGFRGGGIGGGGFAGRPGIGRGGFAGRPGFGNGVAGVRPGFGGRGWYGGNRWRNAGFHRRGYGYGGLGLGLGLAAGGLYGAYGYPGYGYGYDDGYYAPAGYYGAETVTTDVAPGGGDAAVAECARRFKTYDPQSQTYVGKGGVRRSCP